MTDATTPAVDHVAPLQFTLKVVSRCNLDCRYCYVYNGADDSWRKQPAVMSDEVPSCRAKLLAKAVPIESDRPDELVFFGLSAP